MLLLAVAFLKYQAKFVADDIFIFFSEKISIDISCELSGLADNSHEMSILIFFGK